MTATPLDFAIALVCAHVLADFGLGGAQPAADSGPAASVRHALLYGVLTWLLLPLWSADVVWIVLLLAAVRGGLHLWRARGSWPYGRLSPLSALGADQAARLAAIAAALGLIVARDPSGGSAWGRLHQALGLAADADLVPVALTLIAAYALAVPGGSTIVRALLDPYARALPGEDELSLGRVIGYLERLILLTLFLLEQYAAIGLIITAKSVIRIPSIRPAGAGEGIATAEARAGEKITGEYFLIGTLASIAVALFAGLLARRILLLL